MDFTRQEVSMPLDRPPLRGRRWLRFSLRWLIVAMAFLAVLVSHVKTSHDLRNIHLTIERQQSELKQLRDKLGVFEVTDPPKAHVIFVRPKDDRAWRWRIYLPPGRRMQKRQPQRRCSTAIFAPFHRAPSMKSW